MEEKDIFNSMPRWIHISEPDFRKVINNTSDYLKIQLNYGMEDIRSWKIIEFDDNSGEFIIPEGVIAYRLFEKDKEVEKPIQYQIGIDTFDRMKANASFEEIIGGCKLNIDKYIWRKKGSDREDWLKARDYIELGLWAFDNKIEKDK